MCSRQELNSIHIISSISSYFDDENKSMAHSTPYLVSMANRGPNTNASQFFITTAPAPHLDGKHVVFGEVISGQDIVTRVEQCDVGSNFKPEADISVGQSGISCILLQCNLPNPTPV